MSGHDDDVSKGGTITREKSPMQDRSKVDSGLNQLSLGDTFMKPAFQSSRKDAQHLTMQTHIVSKQSPEPTDGGRRSLGADPLPTLVNEDAAD